MTIAEVALLGLQIIISLSRNKRRQVIFCGRMEAPAVRRGMSNMTDIWGLGFIKLMSHQCELMTGITFEPPSVFHTIEPMVGSQLVFLPCFDDIYNEVIGIQNFDANTRSNNTIDRPFKSLLWFSSNRFDNLKFCIFYTAKLPISVLGQGFFPRYFYEPIRQLQTPSREKVEKSNL